MKTIKYIMFFLLFILNTIPLFSKDITMSFGEKIAPFTFPESNSGIELEVIGQALAFKGHSLKPKYFPFARIPRVFKDKRVDAAMTDLGENMSAYGAHYGKPAVWYENVFITLNKNRLTIEKPEDLEGLTVMSFQGAINRYPKWLKQVRTDGNYYEQNNQKLQVIALNRSRIDVILMDQTIFKYYKNRLLIEDNTQMKVVKIHNFVELNLKNYRPIFWDEKIRDDFNAGLFHIKETGKYQEIYDKYLKN